MGLSLASQLLTVRHGTVKLNCRDLSVATLKFVDSPGAALFAKLEVDTSLTNATATAVGSATKLTRWSAEGAETDSKARGASMVG
jgi:hypothetical protein